MIWITLTREGGGVAVTIYGSYFSTKKVDGEFLRPVTVDGQISVPLAVDGY